jgi:hypothetical protein
VLLGRWTRVTPNERLHLTRAPFVVFASDCEKSCSVARPCPCRGVVVAAQVKR